MIEAVPPIIEPLRAGSRRQEEVLAGTLSYDSDEDLLAAIDMMKFDVGETDIRVRKWEGE